MKTNAQQQDQSRSADLNISEALAFNQGWMAGVRGDPFTVQNGQMWVSGYIQYHWLKDGPTRSWKRH